MRETNEPDNGNIGLGKKVEPYKRPEADWKYLGDHMWMDKTGKRCYAPPMPPRELTPVEEFFASHGIF